MNYYGIMVNHKFLVVDFFKKIESKSLIYNNFYERLK